MRSTATTVTFRAARVVSWTWVLVVILPLVLPVEAAAPACRADTGAWSQRSRTGRNLAAVATVGLALTVPPLAAPFDQSHAVSEAPRTCEYVLTLREASGPAPSAADVRLVIGNRDPLCRNHAHAVVLRGVQWLGGTASPQRWFGPLQGITVALENGSEHTSASVIAHTLDAVPMTEHHFEKGLLLTNEEIAVTVPRPAAGAEPVVVVRFQVLQGPEVFIPGPSVQGLTIYALATPDAYHAYLAGGEAKPVLVRETMHSAGSPAELREARIPVRLAAVPPAGGERSSTSAATDSFTSAMVAGHPWRYEVSVERAEDSTVWRFRSVAPHRVGPSGRTFLRFELELRHFADNFAAELAVAALVARAHPDTGLSYAWDLVVQEGNRLWHLRAPCLYSKSNFDRLAANLEKLLALDRRAPGRAMRCACGGGCGGLRVTE